MLIDSTLLAAFAALIVGVLAFWANPGRTINKAFLSSAVNVSIWLLTLRNSFIMEDGLFWLRVCSSVSNGIVFHLWLFLDVASRPELTLRQRLRSGVPWLVVCLTLGLIPLTDFFIPADSNAANRIYGPGYYGFIVGVMLAYFTLFIQAWKAVRKTTGAQRVEIQLMLLGGCSTAISVLLLIAASALLQMTFLVRLVPPILIVFYSMTVWLMTTTKLFDARFVLRIICHRITLGVIVTAFGLAIILVLGPRVPLAIQLFLVIVFSFPITSFFAPYLDRAFHLELRENRDVRQRAYDAARSSMDLRALEDSFEKMVTGWASAGTANVLFGDAEEFHASGLVISRDSSVFRCLEEMRWITPERLNRERPTQDRTETLAFLTGHQIGVMVLSGKSNLAVIVAIGPRSTNSPYTYPETLQLLELSSIMENAYARSHFTAKAERAEQLATVGLMGASVAHEIRNPLVSIRMVSELLPKHYQDPKFRNRFFGLIKSEVDRIDNLTTQLLDMSSPKAYESVEVNLNESINEALALIEAKTNEAEVSLHVKLASPNPIILSDPKAVKQVLLNLCFNAVQAVEELPKDREVWISSSTNNGTAELVISDSGKGIPESSRGSLFEPFHSTKSSGFGLGLAICRDILSSLEASITVAPYVEGEGATFRVTFPCPPRSS